MYEGPTLAGCWAKIERAQHHLRRLHDLVADYMESDSIVGGPVYLDLEHAAYEMSIDVARAPNHMELAVVLGDFLHNARSALDHLVSQLVLLDGSCSPSVQHQFPIALTESAYLGQNGRSGMRKRMLAGVGRDQLKIIDRVQPYRLGEIASTHPLACLQWLSNIDKHRTLHTTLFTTHDALPEDFELDPAAGIEEFAVWSHDGPMVVPARLATIRMPAGDEGRIALVRGAIRFEIGFGDGADRSVTSGTLNTIWTRIGALIFEFKDFFGEHGNIPAPILSD